MWSSRVREAIMNSSQLPVLSSQQNLCFDY
jgi:hypothetical protein